MIIPRSRGVSMGMRRLVAVLLATVVVSCGTAAPAPAPTGAGAASAARPGYLTYAFTSVRDGSRFTLSDFAGKSVLVIGMAVW